MDDPAAQHRLSWFVIVRATLATICAFGSLAMLAMPRTWLESKTGFEPDGGDGSFEVMIAIALGAVALGLVYTLVKVGAGGQDRQRQAA